MRNPSESTNVPRSGPIRRDFEHAMRRLFETKKIVAQPYGAPSKDVSRLVAFVSCSDRGADAIVGGVTSHLRMELATTTNGRIREQ
jgi:hypothetical protein